MKHTLTGKNVLLFGLGGQGKAIALALLLQNISKLCVICRNYNADTISQLSQVAHEKHITLLIVSPIDITDEKQLSAGKQHAEEFLKTIDILIIATGIRGELRHPLLPDADRDLVYKTNLVAPLNIIRLFLEHMSQGGKILLLTSLAIFMPPAFGLNYAGSKAALDVNLDQLRQLTDIKILKLATTYVHTPMASPHCGIPKDTWYRKILSKMKAFRILSPKECADKVLEMLKGNRLNGYLPASAIFFILLFRLFPGFKIRFMRWTGLMRANDNSLDYNLPNQDSQY